MTDARFPERRLNDRRITRLSDAGFRLFVNALTWSVANRTDGIIEAADTALIHGFNPKLASEIIGLGLWVVATEGNHRITVFLDTQTTRAQLAAAEHKRSLDRERQARKRERDGAQGLDELLGERDGPRDVTRDRVRDDIGQAMTEPLQASTGEPLMPVRSLEAVYRKVCAARGCERLPRNSCMTCANHMTDELTYRRSA